MELTKYQRFYIQTMYDYFLENLQWPTFRQVERKILLTHRDFRVLEVARSLEDNPAVHFFYHHLDVQATITLKEICQYPAAEQDLADLTRVIRYCADKYISSSEDNVLVTGVEVGRILNLDESTVRKIGLLLALTRGIFTSFSNPEELIWQLYASQDVLYFEGIQSIDDYFEKLEERNKSYGVGQVTQKVAMEKLTQTALSDIQAFGVPVLQPSTVFYQESSGDSMYFLEQKRHYVQTIYDYFHENAKWPTYAQLEQLLDDQDLDVAEISREMPDGYANLFAYNQLWEELARLSLKAICECENSEEDLNNFVKSIHLFADMHKKRVGAGDFAVTGADVRREFSLSEPSVEKVGVLINGEGGLFNGSGRHVEGLTSTWQFSITRAIRKFRDVESIDDYLERRDNSRKRAMSLADQAKSLLGYMYRKPGSEDAESGIATWTKNLTEPKEIGTKLEVALLNALTRLGIPVLFGGDIERLSPTTGEKTHSGPQTPEFDLVALNYGSPMREPTAVLISCKSTTNQPSDKDIRLLSNESAKVRALLPGWQVFGALVNLGEPTADDYQDRNDIRIWKQSDLQAILHAREYKYLAQFLWTPPWHWKRDIEMMWRNTYKAHHKE